MRADTVGVLSGPAMARLYKNIMTFLDTDLPYSLLLPAVFWRLGRWSCVSRSMNIFLVCKDMYLASQDRRLVMVRFEAV